MIGFLMKNSLVISCATDITRLVDRKEIRLVDVKKLVNAEILANVEVLANAEILVNIEVPVDPEIFMDVEGEK